MRVGYVKSLVCDEKYKRVTGILVSVIIRIKRVVTEQGAIGGRLHTSELYQGRVSSQHIQC